MKSNTQKHCSKCNLVIPAGRKDVIEINGDFFCYEHCLFLPLIGITESDVTYLTNIFHRPANVTEIFNYAVTKQLSCNVLIRDASEVKDLLKNICDKAFKHGVEIDMSKCYNWSQSISPFVPIFNNTPVIHLAIY